MAQWEHVWLTFGKYMVEILSQLPTVTGFSEVSLFPPGKCWDLHAPSLSF